MSSQDFRINAAVHNIVNRCRPSTGQLDFGTTNGVVYVRGPLFADPQGAAEESTGTRVLRQLVRDIRTVPGVRDVVLGVK